MLSPLRFPEDPRPIKFRAFTEAEVRTLASSFERTDLSRDAPEMKEALVARHPLVRELFGLSDDAWRAALRARPDLCAADSFVKEQLKTLVSKTSPRARVFAENERALRVSSPSEYALGRAMYERIVEYGALKAPRDIRAHVDHIKMTEYVPLGKPEDETLLAIGQLRVDVALLPKRERATFDLVTTLLAKVPDAVRETSDMTLSERLQCEQTEHELLHDGEAKWTFDTLKALIARRVCARSAPSVSAAVSAVTAVEDADEADAYEGDEPLSPPPSPPAAPADMPKPGGRDLAPGGRDLKSGGQPLPGPYAPEVAHMMRA